MFVVVWENCVGISIVWVFDIRYVKLYGGFVFVYGLFVYGKCFKVRVIEGQVFQAWVKFVNVYIFVSWESSRFCFFGEVFCVIVKDQYQFK